MPAPSHNPSQRRSRAPEVLYGSREILRRVRDVLGRPGATRRIALVAYLGPRGDAYLEPYKDLHVVCAPEPGATSSHAVRRLIKNGVRVEFSANLHAKVYWSTHGCVVTSANASAHGLEPNGLHEAGGFLAPGTVDIDRLVMAAKPRPVTAKDLAKLDRATALWSARSEWRASRRPVSEVAPSFIDWFSDPMATTWKLGWRDGDEKVAAAQNVRDRIRAEFGPRDPHNWTEVAAGSVKPGEWLLDFSVTARKITEIRWMCVEFIESVGRWERGIYNHSYPLQAVQVYPTSKYGSAPFALTAQFRRAFIKAVFEVGVDRVCQSKLTPPPAFLKTIVRILSESRRATR